MLSTNTLTASVYGYSGAHLCFACFCRRLLARIAFSTSCKRTSNTPLLESDDGAHFSIMHLQEEKRGLVCVRQLGPSACPRVLHINPVQPPQDLPRSQESLWHPASAYIVCVIWPHRYLSPTQASMPPPPCPDYLQLAADHFFAGATV